MAYSTIADVKGSIRETGASPVQLTLSDAKVTEKIVEADALIDGYLGRAYAIPFTSGGVAVATPPLVALMSKYIAVAFCIEWAMSIKNEISSQSKTTAQVQYDRWVSTLKSMIARANAQPILNCDLKSGVTVNADGGFNVVIGSSNSTLGLVTSTTGGYKPTFGEESPEEWRIDPRKLSDLARMGDHVVI